MRKAIVLIFMAALSTGCKSNNSAGSDGGTTANDASSDGAVITVDSGVDLGAYDSGIDANGGDSSVDVDAGSMDADVDAGVDLGAIDAGSPDMGSGPCDPGHNPCRDDQICSVDVTAVCACPRGFMDNGTSCVNVAGSLDGLRWELPCVSDYTSNVCVTTGATMSMTTIGGSPSTHYGIRVHIRGVVEEKTVTGGQAFDESGTQFVMGGTPASDDWNIYSLTVTSGDTSTIYYLNVGTSGNYFCDSLDYTASIGAVGGSTITLNATAVDSGPYEIKNMDMASGTPIVVDGLPPAPDAYNGQFIQMDVISVQRIVL